MTVPVAVVVAQWVLLLTLAVLVVLMYRQLAYLFHLGGVVSGRQQDGLEIGTPAPQFSYRLAGDRQGRGEQRRFVPGGEPAVLLFTDPRCGSCKEAIANLEQVTVGQGDAGLRVLAVTDADLDLIAASDAFATTTVLVGQVAPRVVTTEYQSHNTPLLYGIDDAGVIRAKETTGEAAAIRRLLQRLRDQPPESADHHHAAASKQEVHTP